MQEERMKNILKKINSKDWLCLFLFTAFYGVTVLAVSRGGSLVYGSLKDFSTQHYTIPDYFRRLFYENHDLVPDFAFNLGAGQNIYNFSYYGLLNPIILFSYLLPFVDMLDYIIAAMAAVVLSSVFLFYFYLRKNRYSRLISFLATFSLLCASPFIFHARRHIMFVSYMPFLIMGLFGADRYIQKNKSGLLMLSAALMIFTSYYFSIGGLISLFIFACFKYVRKNGFVFKRIFNFCIKTALRFITAVFISGVLILPTLYALLSGRSDSTGSTSLWELLFGQMGMLYSSYSMGLTAIALVAAVFMLFKGKTESKILSVILILVSAVPIFSFALNGFLYVNAKSLIPFIPLALINVADFLNAVLKQKYKKAISAYLVIVPFAVCLTVNLSDSLMTYQDTFKAFGTDYKNSVQAITAEDSSHRINSSIISEKYINKVISTSEYKSTMYSSTFNSGYREWYTATANAPLNYRNEFIISSSSDLILQMYMGEKYIYTTDELSSPYQKIDSFGNIKLYENPYALPIGYATSEVMSKTDFKELQYPQSILNMLGRAVINDKTNTELIKAETANNPDFIVTSHKNLEYQKTDNGYTVESDKNASMTIKLSEPQLKSKLLFISFDLKAQEQDLTVDINGIKNKLTDKTWKYFNRNTNFAFAVINRDNLLNITFGKGKYEISNLRLSYLDISALEEINRNINPFVIDGDKTKGDIIAGNISVKKDGYFVLSVPYDSGFTVKVDGKKTDYYKTNGAFIGFGISAGEHTVEIEYKAPLKNIGIALSICGLWLFAAICLCEGWRKNGKNIDNSSVL